MTLSTSTERSGASISYALTQKSDGIDDSVKLCARSSALLLRRSHRRVRASRDPNALVPCRAGSQVVDRGLLLIGGPLAHGARDCSGQ
eukprot:3013325-Rhodomonas_salina.4